MLDWVNMLKLSKSKYEAIHPDFRGVWTTERTDIPNWDKLRHQFIGKRTLVHDNALQIEGLSFEILPEGDAE